MGEAPRTCPIGCCSRRSWRFSAIGIYSVNNSSFEIYLTALFGVLGFVWSKLGFPPAPLLLGFVLGPMMEENLRRAMLMAKGDPSVFVTRPISLTFIIITIGILVVMVAPAVQKRRADDHRTRFAAWRGGGQAPGAEDMADLKDKLALIVGAGSGLSASIARRFARAGMRIALAARSIDDLEDLSSSSARRPSPAMRRRPEVVNACSPTSTTAARPTSSSTMRAIAPAGR